MNICIIPSLNQIAIDGEIRIVDLSGLTLPDVWAINWKDDAHPGRGEVEYIEPRENWFEDLIDLREAVMAAWESLVPPTWAPEPEIILPDPVTPKPKRKRRV